MCNCCSYEFWNLGFYSHILVKALVSMSTKGELKVSYTMARKWAGQVLPLAGGHWIIARELTAVCLQRQNQHLIWAENPLLPLWSHSGLLFISVNRPLLKTHYWLTHSLSKAGSLGVHFEGWESEWLYISFLGQCSHNFQKNSLMYYVNGNNLEILDNSFNIRKEN